MNRETWLQEIAAKMAPRFEELGYPLPKFRVSVGFTGAGKVSNVGGECWHIGNSADRTFEIFISPILDDPMRVADILCHELIHAAVGFEHGHKGEFATLALALGLQRPMMATTGGPAFIEWVRPFVEEVCPLPHARLSWREPIARGAEDPEADNDNGRPVAGSSNAKPKQSTRMLKATCKAIAPADGEGGDPVECGYTVRLSKKWADKLGACCPRHGAIDVEFPDAQDDAA